MSSDQPLRTGRLESRPGSQNPFARVERPHIAARLEDALDAWIARYLIRRGWTVRVVPYAGYGSDGWIRVLARTVLASPVVGDRDMPDSGATTQSAQILADVRGWRSFLTAPVAGTTITVMVGEERHELLSDRAGYVDAVIPAQLPDGWQTVKMHAAGTQPVDTPIQVVPAGATRGVVCDIDDTLMVTRLPRPFIAFWNSFVRRVDAREAVPGMSRLLRELAQVDEHGPVIYLSTGAWDTAGTISRFLKVHGSPNGTLLLTDWGPTNTGWFRSGKRHKVTQLRHLFHQFPQVRWTLVGDDGQHDPEIYAGALVHHPGHVAGVLIRQLTFAEHVLASPSVLGNIAAQAPHPDWAVRVVSAPDGERLLQGARRTGLLKPTAAN